MLGGEVGDEPAEGASELGEEVGGLEAVDVRGGLGGGGLELVSSPS